MPFKIGIIEIVLILVIVFIIFGAGKLPQLFEMFSKGARAFRAGKKDDAEAEVKTKKKKGGPQKS
jgi:sec-independent protein translocase protein TatA